MSGGFDQWTDRDIVDLVDQNPFAWVVSAGGGLSATPLPMLVETDGTGRPVTLLGHIAKRNPQVDRIRASPAALFLFSGPHGYISPEHLSSRDWAPTWNYAVARIEARIAFDEALNDEALARLVEKMERGRPRPWSIAEMGARYDGLKQHIIAFRAAITSIDGRFKLGQDETPDVFSEILAGLGDQPLAGWMRRFGDR